MLLVGCGSSNAPAPVGIASKPDVIITIDGPQHACAVALYSEAQASTIPCADLVAFIRDELRVSSGAVYDLRTIPGVANSDIANVRASLKQAGYRFIGEL